MKGGARPGTGPKPRPDDKMIRVAISLTPEQYAWLSNRPEGMGVTVRYFIESLRGIEKRVGHELPLADMGAIYIGWHIRVAASSSPSPSPSPAWASPSGLG